MITDKLSVKLYASKKLLEQIQMKYAKIWNMESLFEFEINSINQQQL